MQSIRSTPLLSLFSPLFLPLILLLLFLLGCTPILSQSCVTELVRDSHVKKSETPTKLASEPFRPAYHYTPLRNFMNDPNGLVYFQGEYHLFHQYNPFENRWGHMSWNHAVSRDLVHWQPLPIALQEEQGVMIFSGSAVADVNNTSGFGSLKAPPLVAIYTGHRVADEMQSQCLAYSVDRGRTWTKYANNPVLAWEKDFRDPKVFWYAPTRKWIMVVTKAAEKKLRFYSSPDLKTWTMLSEFGPEGVPANKKANWECPDLFPLPIDGEPGKLKWVLHVGMGDGHISGGSGGEYFIGEFDGVRFHNDNPVDKVHWDDYGKDDYAAVSWSGAKGPHGEALWIGWMSNWRYANDLPTSPWRNALTIPRLLSLHRFEDGLRVVQRPVPQIQALRGAEHDYFDRTVSDQSPFPADRSSEGDSLEIIAQFELNTASEFGLSVRSSSTEQTLVGYNVNSKSLFVDRTQSGQKDFNNDFAGRQSGPLRSEANRVTLHVFVDRSSVEVFGNRGETVISDLIFPKQDSRGLSVFARDGSVRLVKMQIWQLKSANTPRQDKQAVVIH